MERLQLVETSLNRFLSYMDQYDIACITAFRDKFANATDKTLDDRPQELKDRDEQNGVTNPAEKTPYEYTTAEKKSRNHDLMAALLHYGYGVTKMRGNYIENFGTINAKEVGENSFFVVNLHNNSNFLNNVFELSEYFNQNSFLYKPKGKNTHAFLIGTNAGEFPGYGRQLDQGEVHINVDSEFRSRVGNSSFSFVNANGKPIKADHKPYDFDTRKDQRRSLAREAKELIGLDCIGDHNFFGRMAIASAAESTKRNIEEMRKPLTLFQQYIQNLNEAASMLCEWGKDMKGWLNIGYIKDGSPFGSGGDIYLMVDPNGDKSDASRYKYFSTGFNTKPDGTGHDPKGIPQYTMQWLEIYPEYQDTWYGELFLGKRKTKEDEAKHAEFMRGLNHVGNGKVCLTHNSNFLIKDGKVRYTGHKNNYSNNSDVGIYFWGSAKPGSDPSNGGQYTYYCEVSEDSVYDFETNLERLTLQQAMGKYPYVAQYWQGGPAIVVTSYAATPITWYCDNSNGQKFYGNGEPLNEWAVNETSRRQKAQKTIMGGRKQSVRTFAIISPENPMAKPASREDNTESRKKFIEWLKASHIPYFPLDGHYAGKENSFILYNVDFDTVSYVGMQYGQQSFIYVRIGENGKYVYEFWEHDKPNAPYRKTKEEDRYVDATNDDDMYSKISRDFKFRIPYVFEHACILKAIVEQRIPDEAEREHRLNTAVNEGYSGRNRFMARGFLYGDRVDELTRHEKRRNEKNAENLFRKGRSGYNGVRCFGILSAENSDSKSAGRQQNKRASKSLSDTLKSLHYAFVPQIGHFGGNDERSYFIFNIGLRELMFYAGLYEQTSFFFCTLQPDGEVLSQYWEKQDIAKKLSKDNPYVMKEETTDWIDASNAENYSVIGKHFKYTIPLSIFEEVDRAITEWKVSPVRGDNGDSYVDMSITGVGYTPAMCRKGIYEHILRSVSCFKN